MRIQFEIKEKFSDIVDEIFSSSKWKVEVVEERKNLKRLFLIDPSYDSQAQVEIWPSEIHIKTAWSNYTYRVFLKENVLMCEYIGAYRGFMEQVLLPTFTPVHNILETIVLDTSIEGAKKETLRQYGVSNLRQRHKKQKDKGDKKFETDHPTIVYDEFIKEGALIPSPWNVPE